MFMAASDPKVTFTELQIEEGVRLQGCAYLVKFETTIKVAHYRKAGDAGWSGDYYGPEYNFSHQQFTEAKPELEKSGCMGFLRKSAAMMSGGEDGDVLIVFPEATGSLAVKSIRPLGDPNAEATIKLPDGTIYPVQKYYPENAEKQDEFKPLIPVK